MQSVGPGVLLAYPHPSAPLKLVGVQAGWAGVTGESRQAGLLAGISPYTWAVPGVSLPSSLWFLGFRSRVPGQLLGAEISTAAPKGRSEPAQERGIKRPQLGRVKLLESSRQCQGRRRPLVTAAWQGEGRRRGKRAGPQREAKEGKLNVRAKDQGDRWHRSRSAPPARPPRRAG